MRHQVGVGLRQGILVQSGTLEIPSIIPRLDKSCTDSTRKRRQLSNMRLRLEALDRSYVRIDNRQDAFPSTINQAGSRG